MHHIFKYGFNLHFLYDAQTSWVITPGDILSVSCSRYLLSVWRFKKTFGWPANIWKVAFMFTPTPLLPIRWLLHMLLARRDRQVPMWAKTATVKAWKNFLGCANLKFTTICVNWIGIVFSEFPCHHWSSLSHIQSVLRPSTYLLQLLCY